MRPKLTLKKAPPPVPADPEKIRLSEFLNARYVSREGRYIQQVRTWPLHVIPDIPDRAEMTWVDIPLVPETYGP